MYDEDRRSILERVAAGELSAEDAAALFRAYDDVENAEQPTADPVETPRRASAGPRAIRVELTAGKVRIVGDPTVRTVSVDGAHQLIEADDVVIVECGGLGSLVNDLGIGVHRRPGRNGKHRSFVITSPKPWRSKDSVGETIVRVNPDLALECSVTAGALRACDLRGSVEARIEAGSMRLDRSAGPLDIRVQAGSFSGNVTLTEGDSSIRCEFGSVSLDLDPSSNVEVSLPRAEPDGDDNTFVVGDGNARLSVVTMMGSCRIDVAEAAR